MYYKVEDKEALIEAFKGIATSVEKKVSVNLSWILLVMAFGFLSLEWLLVNTLYRTIP